MLKCQMTHFDESTSDKQVKLGHFDNTLFQSFQLQCYKQLCI
jgi:hypothetical protein